MTERKLHACPEGVHAGEGLKTLGTWHEPLASALPPVDLWGSPWPGR